MIRRVLFILATAVLAVAIYQAGSRRAFGQGFVMRVIGPATVVVGESAYYLEVSNPPYGWRQLPYGGNTLPPVPVSSLASYEPMVVITDGGEGWYATPGGWVSVGCVPGGNSPAIRSTWGGVKAKYR